MNAKGELKHCLQKHFNSLMQTKEDIISKLGELDQLTYDLYLKGASSKNAQDIILGVEGCKNNIILARLNSLGEYNEYFSI